jgi:HK97 family phage prohead protease
VSSDARRKAASERAAACTTTGRRVAGTSAPSGAARSLPFQAKELRAELVDRDGKEFFRVDGYASVVERGYEMYDFFGAYNEVVDKDAFNKTLAASPDVAFLINHRGITMARTTNGTLELSVDSLGLRSTAYLNPERWDVQLLMSAIIDQLVDEMSFAFMLTEGEWNDDFDEFRILEADIHRGDVSAVNYGANPYTSIAARSLEILSDLEHLPAGAAREAMSRLARSAGLKAPYLDDAARVDTVPETQTREPEPAAPTFAVRSLNDVAAWLADAEAHKLGDRP